MLPLHHRTNLSPAAEFRFSLFQFYVETEGLEPPSSELQSDAKPSQLDFHILIDMRDKTWETRCSISILMSQNLTSQKKYPERESNPQHPHSKWGASASWAIEVFLRSSSRVKLNLNLFSWVWSFFAVITGFEPVTPRRQPDILPLLLYHQL